MTFPVEFHVLGRTIPAHLLFEVIAYTAGFQLYLALRRRATKARGLQSVGPLSPIPFEQMAWILVGCVFGALIGSKILAWAESPLDYWNARADPRVFLGGKTIVGGLL